MEGSTIKGKYRIYVRASTPADLRETLDMQAQDCINEVPRNQEYKVYIDDNKSGGDIQNRPAFQQMMREIKPGDTIFVWKSSRFARNYIQNEEIITKKLLPEGMGFRSLKEGIHIPPGEKPSAAGMMFIRMLAVFAEYEKDNIREWSTRGKQGARERGKVAQSKPIFGYMRLSKEEGKKVVPNPEEVKVLKEVFNYTKQGMSRQKIAEIFGKSPRWVEMIQTRDVYWSGRYPQKQGDSTLYIEVEAVVDKKEIDAVRRKMRGKEKRERVGPDTFLLREKIYCLICDAPMNSIDDARGYQYYQHKCPEHDNKYKNLDKKKLRIDERVLEGIREHFLKNPAEVLKKVFEQETEQVKRMKEMELRKNQLNLEIQKITAEMNSKIEGFRDFKNPTVKKMLEEQLDEMTREINRKKDAVMSIEKTQEELTEFQKNGKDIKEAFDRFQKDLGYLTDKEILKLLKPHSVGYHWQEDRFQVTIYPNVLFETKTPAL